MIPSAGELANDADPPAPGPASGLSAASASPSAVALVVPGRNVERTLGLCLGAAAPLLAGGRLGQVVYVDDGSSDASASIAAAFGAAAAGALLCLDAGGRGPGAARNVGWRAASAALVWFIDADCVVEPEALDRLLAELSDPEVGGVGGSYANAVADSLLARLIHAEIRERHARMRGDTDYLGSFNVLYRRALLEEVGGFDEGWVNGPGAPGAEDADLSYRIAARGHRLRFRLDARVAHHHPVALSRYLRAQRLHGFWGVRLYRRHPGRGRRNAYSGALDHLQPVLALAALASLPVAAWRPAWAWVAAGLLALLLATTLPMTLRLVKRRGAEMLLFAPLAALRAGARALGLGWGVLDMVTPGQWRPRR
jgi:glycosyltransferase involved in cell wall biosynthesis